MQTGWSPPTPPTDQPDNTMSTRPAAGRKKDSGNPHEARSGGWATASDAFSELPTASLCHLKRCADCVRHALARDIGRHYEALTGLQLHLRRGTGPGSWCPAAERRLVRNPAIPQRCALCAEDNWQAATREKADGQVFSGACGRQNCWLSISAADGCSLSLVIQTAEPQAAVRRASGVALKPATDPAEARDLAQAGPATDQASCQAGMDCLPGGDGFGQAVTLLKLVAFGLESLLEAEELRWALEEARRVQQAVLARDTRLRRVLKKRLPELSGEPVLPEATPQAGRLVEQVRDFLLRNYQCPLIGLGEAAASVHRSGSYLSTLFARETGVSFHSYLQELRLTKARELLRDPRLTVAEVAQASGYASAGWFRHSFKHHVGLSPSDWRRAHHYP